MVLPMVSVLLAEEGNVSLKERAVEFYALANNQLFVANSPFYEDIAGKHIAAATASFPPDVVAAVQERGRAFGWWETVEGLLEELSGLGWEIGLDAASA
jgi:hypothetical protein